MGTNALSKLVAASLCLTILDACGGSKGTSRLASASASINDATPSSTITISEAEGLIQSLPIARELRAKGMDVKWDVQTVATMNNGAYYFFWIYNATAQKKHDIGSISVGNYAVNKYTADVRVWQVSTDVFHGEDGVLVTASEIERLQEELRRKHGINSASFQRYRSEHLANKIIPREEAESAERLPVTEQVNDTSELSCWKDSDHLISRSARSAVISSGTGYRANAEVQATAFKPKYQETYTGPLCENRVKLFLAKDSKSEFQTLFDSGLPKNDCVTIEGKDWCGVKGIQLVDWSRDGRFLLANLVLWEYESDALVMRVPVIYDVGKNESARPDIYQFFDEHYEKDAKQHCEFELLTQGFSADGQLIISASRPPLNETYDQVFCFDGKQAFLFDLGTNKISDLPADYRLQHFGIWKSGGGAKP